MLLAPFKPRKTRLPRTQSRGASRTLRVSRGWVKLRVVFLAAGGAAGVKLGKGRSHGWQLPTG